MKDIEAQVFQALSNAVKNGYDMHSSTVEFVAEDLKTNDSDLENVDLDTLKTYVRKWRLLNG